VALTLLCLASLAAACFDTEYVKRDECPHWSYDVTAPNGPYYWGNLCEAYETCKSGVKQSPVSLYSRGVPFANEKTSDLVPSYHEEHAVTFLNNGHTLMINNTDTNNTLKLPDGDIFTLSQFHFHDVSEHTLDDIYYPLEMHLVHTKGHDTAILAFFFQQGAPSELLAEIEAAISKVEEQGNETTVPLLELQTLVGQPFTFYYYQGSLTTPPCTENVQWFISATILTASADQIKTIGGVMGRNSRPPQPMYNRQLLQYRLGNSGSAAELLVALFLGCLLATTFFDLVFFLLGDLF